MNWRWDSFSLTNPSQIDGKLTVVRTYNSLNPRSGDFGHSWTYSLLGMDVRLDDERKDVTLGTAEALLAFPGGEEDENGLPRVLSLRTGGGWDVTLTLPDGRRTTFAFDPRISQDQCTAYARWKAPLGVYDTLGPLDSGVINLVPTQPPVWQDSDYSFGQPTFENHDVAGWALTNRDGTRYIITRGQPTDVVWGPEQNGHYFSVRTYGAPRLSQIIQRTGDTLTIGDNGILHYAGTNGLTTTNLTRSVLFDRDSQGRIIAIYDPNSQLTNSLIQTSHPVLRYLYHADTDNLLQVLKLTDRAAGIYVTNKYHYDNPNFPHYITSIDNPLGVPVARNEYDDAGRLTAVTDADGKRTEFIHNSGSRLEIITDRMTNRTACAYDERGNVTTITNALNRARLMDYDEYNNQTNEVLFLDGHRYATNRQVYSPNGLLLATFNPLGYSNTFIYGQHARLECRMANGKEFRQGPISPSSPR